MTTTVAGTVAGGEPRITRLDDYRLDMAPAEVMLITRHMDRPGTVGRIGIILGEADVNISAMHLARSRPREDALMILALDDEVPDGVADAIRADESVKDIWTIRLGTRALSGRRRSRPAWTRRSSSSATASSEYIVEGRFQGQAETPLPAIGRRQAALVAERLADAARAARPARSPTGPPHEIVHSPLGRAAETAAAIGAALDAAGSAGPLRPDAGFLEIGQGEWEGLHRARSPRGTATILAGWRRPTDRGLGARRRVPRRGRRRVRDGLAATLARLVGGAVRRPLDARRSRATARRGTTSRGPSSSPTTASSRSRC